MEFLKKLFDWLVDQIVAFFAALIAVIQTVIDWVWSVISAVLIWLMNLILWGWHEIWTQILVYFNDKIQGIFTDYPSFQILSQWSLETHTKINHFFPLNELFSVLTVILLTWIAVFAVKVFLKLVPGIY